MTHRLRVLPRIAFSLSLFAVLFIPAIPALSQTSSLDAARRLITAEDKGHCHACHQFPNDPQIRTRATIGPAMAGMRARFPDRSRLISVIRDARGANAETVMPPYGPHRILSDAEISVITDYLLTQ